MDFLQPLSSMSQPLKILQIVPSISLVYGGPSQMVRGLSKALTQTGAAGDGADNGF